MFLLTFIFICAFLAHYLAGGETLLEYAVNNPEQAYGIQSEGEDIQTPDSLPETPLTNIVDSAPSETTPTSSGGKNDDSTVGAPVTSDKSASYTDSKDSIAAMPDENAADSGNNTEKPAEESGMMEQRSESHHLRGRFFL